MYLQKMTTEEVCMNALRVCTTELNKKDKKLKKTKEELTNVKNSLEVSEEKKKLQKTKNKELKKKIKELEKTITLLRTSRDEAVDSELLEVNNRIDASEIARNETLTASEVKNKAMQVLQAQKTKFEKVMSAKLKTKIRENLKVKNQIGKSRKMWKTAYYNYQKRFHESKEKKLKSEKILEEHDLKLAEIQKAMESSQANIQTQEKLLEAQKAQSARDLDARNKAEVKRANLETYVDGMFKNLKTFFKQENDELAGKLEAADKTIDDQKIMLDARDAQIKEAEITIRNIQSTSDTCICMLHNHLANANKALNKAKAEIEKREKEHAPNFQKTRLETKKNQFLPVQAAFKEEEKQLQEIREDLRETEQEAESEEDSKDEVRKQLGFHTLPLRKNNEKLEKKVEETRKELKKPTNAVSGNRKVAKRSADVEKEEPKRRKN
uniref:Coiled-coil domain-containing protein 176 n=1 Tax=Caenorhabditis tropicalis TaxID=1561998 RepID=A0A1I7SZX0_9PELO